jgi:hypothetical protein
MVRGILPGDDDFDPERIEKGLEQLRNPSKPPSDRAILRAVRIASTMEKQSDLQHSLLLPMTPEQEQDTLVKLEALSTKLSRLLAEEREEQQEGSESPPD